MKQKRIYSVIASVAFHIILAVIIGLLFTEHYWTYDENAIDVNIIRTQSHRKVEYRTHRPVSLPTTQHTVNPKTVDLSNRTNLTTAVSSVNNPATIQKINTEIRIPDDVTVPNLQVATDLPHVTTRQSSAVVPPSVTPTMPKVKPDANVVVSPKPINPSGSGFTEFLDNTLPDATIKGKLSTTLRNPVMLPQGQLGGILTGTKDNLRGHIRIIRPQTFPIGLVARPDCPTCAYELDGQTHRNPCRHECCRWCIADYRPSHFGRTTPCNDRT